MPVPEIRFIGIVNGYIDMNKVWLSGKQRTKGVMTLQTTEPSFTESEWLESHKTCVGHS